MRTDHKKKTRELVAHYKQIGILEGRDYPDSEKYSIHAKTREIQRSASALKIAQLRKSFEQLIGAQSKPEDDDLDSGADHPFTS